MVSYIVKFTAYGHKNVQATHKTTLEITKETYLTLKGDCIVGIRSSIACSDIPQEALELAKHENCKIKLILNIENKTEIITGYGHPKLTYKNPTSFVIRKSSFVCDRTLMIKADKSAKDLAREFVDLLKNENTKIEGIIHFELT